MGKRMICFIGFVVSVLFSFKMHYLMNKFPFNFKQLSWYYNRDREMAIEKCYKIERNRSKFSEYIWKNVTVATLTNSSTYQQKTCYNYMTMTSPGGRTGNQLFQIAALFGISFDHDFIPIVDPSFPLLTYFDLPNVSPIGLKMLTMCAPPYPGIFYDCFKHSGGQLVKNMTLYGYFQSWKYFKNNESIMRTILKIRPAYLQIAKSFMKRHSKDGLKNACIHVRRGDFTEESHKQRGFAMADVDFIHRAIQYCEFNFKTSHFFVLSDDIKWCKNNIKRNVTFSHFKDPGYDLALMSLCDHVIVTSGSFGWWGACLSKGTAVYFKGYPRPGSYQSGRYASDDYYPSNWIAL